MKKKESESQRLNTATNLGGHPNPHPLQKQQILLLLLLHTNTNLYVITTAEFILLFFIYIRTQVWCIFALTWYLFIFNTCNFIDS